MNHEIDPIPAQVPQPPDNLGDSAPDPGLPAAPPTRTWWARHRRLLIPAAGLAVVGAAAAAVLVLVVTPRTSVEKMLPATVDVYAVANLDPSVSQKMNLLRAVHRFPDTSTDQKLADQLDKALKDSGITFTGDIQPWLGAQVGVAARTPQGNADPPVALFAVSRDDAKAGATLTKLRGGLQGKKYLWHDTTYGGVTITVGAASTSTKPSSGSLKAGAYANVDHVLVLATPDAWVRKVVDSIPSSSDGFFAFANVNRTIHSALDQAGPDPSVRKATDSAGLTGPQGILQHLTGDFAVEAELDRSAFPSGAVMLGTDDATRMRNFFNGILGLAAGGQVGRSTTSTYRGGTITTMAIPGIGTQDHFLPAFAVLDGMGILASTPTELKAIIDAHKDHTAITRDATYGAAATASLPNPVSVFYLDLAKIVKAIETAPAGSAVQGLHLKATANLTPLRAFMLTSESGPDGIVERFVVLVQ